MLSEFCRITTGYYSFDQNEKTWKKVLMIEEQRAAEANSKHH
jgi:hypothetical protein